MRDFYHEEKAGTNERESHHHEGRDPHVWLDFALAQQMAHKIYENHCDHAFSRRIVS